MRMKKNCVLSLAIFLTGCASIVDVDPRHETIEGIEKLDSDRRIVVRDVNDERDMSLNLIGYVRTGVFNKKTRLRYGRGVTELVKDVFVDALETSGVQAENLEAVDYFVDVDLIRLDFHELPSFWSEYGRAVAEMDVTFVHAETEKLVMSTDIVKNRDVQGLDVTAKAEESLCDVIEASARAFVNEGVKKLVSLPVDEIEQIVTLPQTQREAIDEMTVQPVGTQTRGTILVAENISGFLIGLNVTRTLPLTSDIEMSSGGGYALSLGWRSSSGSDIRLRYFISMHNVDSIPVSFGHQTTMAFGGLALDLRYHFSLEKRSQPYGLIGVGSYALVDFNENALSGLGINCGIGCGFFLNDHLSIGPEAILYPFSYSVIGKNGVYGRLNRRINGTTLALSVLATCHF
jgi:hypothetical protein